MRRPLNNNACGLTYIVRDIVIEIYRARRRLLPYAGRVIVCEMIGVHIHKEGILLESVSAAPTWESN